MRRLINFCIFVGQFQGFLTAQLPWDSAVVWKYEIVQGRETLCAQLRGRLKHDTRKPTGIKDLLKKTKPKPSTAQDAINSKTQSCRKTNLMEIFINLQNIFCIRGKLSTHSGLRNWFLNSIYLSASWSEPGCHSAQILLHLHLVKRDCL